MATTLLFIIIALLTVTIVPWVAERRRAGVHHTDLMTGDEGEEW